MANPQAPPTTGVKDEVLHVEDHDPEEQIQKLPITDKVDEFGAHTKTDPKEIALVRKLDLYMLVR